MNIETLDHVDNVIYCDLCGRIKATAHTLKGYAYTIVANISHINIVHVH